ncbi:MAG: hypothetical protein KAJ63_06365 [Methyloprofundus sp.]|nr:hypothetical protein [Methyloprofundus sp.]
MKKYLLLSLLSCFFLTQPAQAKAKDYTKTPDYNPYFVPFDLLITRPLGLATTVVGTALFVVMSPFTALSAIAPPHDAFERVADVFIVVPATYTFLRPMGKFLCPGNCRPTDADAAKRAARQALEAESLEKAVNKSLDPVSE